MRVSFFGLALPVLAFVFALLPDRADPAPVAVTVTQKGPIETLAADGSVASVTEATVGTRYTLVKVQDTQVLLQDSAGTHYLIPLNCTDCPPPPPPPPPPAPAPQPAAVAKPAAVEVIPAPQLIQPGEIWPDDRGKHIQAHGGGVIQLGDTFYWFGEDRGKDNDPKLRYVGCYSSKDLAHWKFRNQVVKADDPAQLGEGWILERPKVFYNAMMRTYVMYAHFDNKNYSYAGVGVFTCDTVDGNYQYVNSFRPLDCESRDIGQFIDDDGSAYLIFEDRPTGFHIAKLSDDYLSVERDVHVFRKEDGGALEGGALVYYDGLYYVVGSQMSGWDPNSNHYATAPSLEGPWSRFKDIAPPEKRTYGAQSSMLLKVVGSKTTTVIFMGDFWKPYSQWNSRYLWMPLEIGDGKLWLPEPKPWTLNVSTGEAVIKP